MLIIYSVIFAAISQHVYHTMLKVYCQCMKSLHIVYLKSLKSLRKVSVKSSCTFNVPVKESRPYNDNLWTHFFLKVDSPFPKSRLSFPWKCTFYENQRYYHSFFFFSCLLRTNLGSSDKSRFEKVSLCSNSSFWYFS